MFQVYLKWHQLLIVQSRTADFSPELLDLAVRRV